MFPYIELFNKKISLYTICALVGILISGYLICKNTRKRGHDDNDMITLLLISVIGVFLGGHLLYGITNINLIIKVITNFNKIGSFTDFLSILMTIFGGSVYYGGLIGGLLIGFIYMKKKKLPIDEFSDIIAPFIPLFHMFGRIGCFLVGCCYGIESKIGFVYHHSAVPLADGVVRFPIQLVEAFYNLILFIILKNLFDKEKFKGKLLYIYLLLYSVGRFILEFFRGDMYRGFVLGLSTSQFISILIFILALTILIIKYVKAPKK